MYNLGGDLVIAGHDHLYERHAPVNTDQRRDDVKGIRQFTVGTGGVPLYNRVRQGLNSELLISNYGVLRLKLDPALLRVAVHGHERQHSRPWLERLPLASISGLGSSGFRRIYNHQSGN